VTYAANTTVWQFPRLPGDPGILPGDPRLVAFLQLSGLIDRQDRSRIAQPAHDEPLQRGQRRRPVPAVLAQQRLHPPRRRVPGRLRQLPARPAVPRLRKQRADIGERGEPRPGLREHPRQQREQFPPQFPQPRPVTYDGPDGHLAIQSSHKAMIVRRPSPSAKPAPRHPRPPTR
jgi:hypothetical protein